MMLVPIVDASGEVTQWINPDHVVSVLAIFRNGARSVDLEAELKLDGMPLQRIQLGNHADRTAAERAFAVFVDQLQVNPDEGY